LLFSVMFFQMPGSSDMRISAWSDAIGLSTRRWFAGSNPKARTDSSLRKE